MTYKTFVFEHYEFDAQTKTLQLRYGYDDALHFTETFRFDFDFIDYNSTALDRALQQLFFTAGVSYYKAYVPPAIRVNAGQIDKQLQTFLSNTYQRGLGEFWYVNQLDPNTPVQFPVTSSEPLLVTPLTPLKHGSMLVGIGGGKDSLVSIELLRDSGRDIATWSLNHRPQLTPLVERIGMQHYWVERTLDQQIIDLQKQGAYNGHIPISAIIAATGTIVAILTGRQDQIVSNEQSANEPTLTYQGVAINHQYSKSQEFEKAYQDLLAQSFGSTIRYYSLLRPLSELRIAELFATRWFDTYHGVFSSCNRAFTHTSRRLFWDGTCPKCAFVYLAFTPFLSATKLQELFNGKNLLLDPSLSKTYQQLLGIDAAKPLECVGEIKESRAAMREAQALHPELKKYVFDIPNEYDFRALSSHCIPPEVYDIIEIQLVS